MLQDISQGHLDNAYYDKPIQPEDFVICFRENEVLLCIKPGDIPAFPTYREASRWLSDWKPWGSRPWRFAFHMLGADYHIFMGVSGSCPDADYAYRSVRSFREGGARDTCFAFVTCWHLYQWYRKNRFCGSCGTPTVHDAAERMVRCPQCGNMIFPRISPAVIAAVTDGDRLLLTKYAGRGYHHYALVAGFAEIGETLEQTVRREVMEEVGLQVKNIRYYKSQPWGIDGNLLSGFYCDLDGDDTIHLDERELSLADWHHRDALPVHDDGVSLTREMIGAFERGEEPQFYPLPSSPAVQTSKER